MTLALQDINVGAVANDGTGDKPRAAGAKINANNAAIIAYLKALANLDTVGTAQIDNSAVTLAKIANIGTGTLLGNAGGSPAAPAALTPSQAKGILDITALDVSGLGAFALISSLAFSSLTGIPTTLSGYGIMNAYTSAQVDTLLAAKADTSSLSNYLTTTAAAIAYQPLDSDLTAIAALTTTTFGRSLLTQADAAAARTTLGITATSPGGSATQVQYNNAGAFAGDSGFTYSSTNKAITLGGATVTASAPVLDLSQTWNNSGVTFTGWKLNVTDTASASASLLIDLQVGGVSKSAIRKSGDIAGAAFYAGTFASAPNYFGTTTVILGSTTTLTWANSTATAGSADVILARDAANTLALRNSTNAQTFNWYFSYTDGSNFTRGALKTSSGVVEVAAESAGTGTANIDLKLTTKGTGVVQYGTHSAIAAETVTGYITIKDAGGTTRKLAVVS